MLKLAKFMRPYTAIALVVCLLLLLQSISQLYLPTLMADIVDKGIVNGDVPYIWQVGWRMLLFALLVAVCTIIAGYLSAKVAAGFGRDLRLTVFQKVEGFSLNEFDRIGTASLITRTTNDITQVQQVVLMGLRMLVTAPMMCIGGIIMALSRDVGLSWVLLLMLPVLSLLVVIVAKKASPCLVLCKHS